MNNIKLNYLTSLVKGIAFVVLGVFHCIVTFRPVTELIGPMSDNMALEFRVWFFGVGMFLIFVGLIDILAFKGMKLNYRWAWNSEIISALFCTICGLGGVMIFREGPPFFIAFAGLFQTVPLIIAKNDYNKRI